MSFNIHKEVARWLRKTQDSNGISDFGEAAYGYDLVKEALSQMAASGEFQGEDFEEGMEELLHLLDLTQKVGRG